MNKTAFNKLKNGDRVNVTGKQDGKTFLNEEGVVVEMHATNYYAAVKFDNWKDGHGPDDNQWNFYDFDARKFVITVLPPLPKVSPVKPAKKRPHGKQEYKGNGKHAWEAVIGNTVRLRVPGGWLYGSYLDTANSVIDQTFVPVPTAVGYAV